MTGARPGGSTQPSTRGDDDDVHSDSAVAEQASVGSAGSSPAASPRTVFFRSPLGYLGQLFGSAPAPTTSSTEGGGRSAVRLAGAGAAARGDTSTRSPSPAEARAAHNGAMAVQAAAGVVEAAEDPQKTSADASSGVAAVAHARKELRRLGLPNDPPQTVPVERPMEHRDWSGGERFARTQDVGTRTLTPIPVLTAEEASALADVVSAPVESLLVLRSLEPAALHPSASEVFSVVAGLNSLIRTFGLAGFASRCVATVHAVPLLVRHILDQRVLQGQGPRHESELADQLSIAVAMGRHLVLEAQTREDAWTDRLQDEIRWYEAQLSALREKNAIDRAAAVERVGRRDSQLTQAHAEIERLKMQVEDAEGRAEVLRSTLATAQAELAAASRSQARAPIEDVDSLLEYLFSRAQVHGNWVRLRELLDSFASGTRDASSSATLISIGAFDLPPSTPVPPFSRRTNQPAPSADESAEKSVSASGSDQAAAEGLAQLRKNSVELSSPKQSAHGVSPPRDLLPLLHPMSLRSDSGRPAELRSARDSAGGAVSSELREDKADTADHGSFEHGWGEADDEERSDGLEESAESDGSGSKLPSEAGDSSYNDDEPGDGSGGAGGGSTAGNFANKSSAASTPSAPLQQRVYPTEYEPTDLEPLSSKTRPPVTLRDAQELVPPALKWDSIRLDVQELMRLPTSRRTSHGRQFLRLTTHRRTKR